MLKEKWLFFLSLLLCVIGAFFYLQITHSVFSPLSMTAKINRITQFAAANWPDLTPSEAPQGTFDFTVLDHQGAVLMQTTAATATTISEAIQGHYMILDVPVANQPAGKVLINTELPFRFRQMQTKTGVLFLTGSGLIAFVAISYWLFLNLKILKPFHNLTGLAANIAAGNLDIPLPMDQHNLFGPFTSSLDLMREELAKARYQEALANKSKKELVASLSHDIKTPITSIKLLSELLEITTADEAAKIKIKTIYKKADQIEHLINNLFQASLEELGQLPVNVHEESSQLLPAMIQTADFYQLVRLTPVPDCLIDMDLLRTQQVLDNIIHNSFKYARTAIDVSFLIVDEFLKITIKDFGAGVPADDLPYLCQKYFRGQLALTQKTAGSGLGLYLASYLMEQMGGLLQCSNHSEGFQVELFLPLC